MALRDADTRPIAKQAALEATSIQSGYGKKQVLFDISVRVMPGEIVAVLGHNGAGKTTLLRVLDGLLPAWRGQVQLHGRDVTQSAPADRVKAGLSLSVSEAPVFRDHSVEDNLSLGAFLVRDKAVTLERRTRVTEMFPVLRARKGQLAGTLSGGEQRMLALAIALMASPRVLLLDEPSLGLAPSLVQQFLGDVRRIADEQGIAVLLVEQNVRAALRVASRAYFMRLGHIILEETSAESMARANWWDLF